MQGFVFLGVPAALDGAAVGLSAPAAACLAASASIPHAPPPRSTLPAMLHISDYALASAILKDNQLFSATAADVTLPQQAHLAFRAQAAALLQSHLPWIKTQMQAIANELITKIKKTSFDLQKELIETWCAHLSLHLLGISPDKANEYRLFEQVQAIFFMQENEVARQAAMAATSQLSQFFLQEMDLRRSNSNSDFLSHLANKSTDMLSFVIQLFVGTTASLPLLLGNICWALLQHPTPKELYLKNPAAAVNELLRYAGAAQWVLRIVTQNNSLGGHYFQKGDKLMVWLSRANKDASVFDAPDVLDVCRHQVRHLSLGLGDHACLGAPLIREACEILPASIFQHFPQLRLTGSAVLQGGSSSIVGVQCMEVVVE